MEGHVPLHVSSVEGVDGGHRLLIDPGTNEGEDEAPDPEYEHAAGEPHQADGAQGGEKLDAEIKQGGEEEEILQRQEEEGQAEHLIELLQQVDQLLHLLPESPDGDALVVVVGQVPVRSHGDTEGEVGSIIPSAQSLLGLQLLPDDVICDIFIRLCGLVNYVDAEDAVRIAQQSVNLLVNEGECVENDGYYDHEEDLAEKDNVDAHDVRSEVDPKYDVTTGLREVFCDERQLVQGGHHSPVGVVLHVVAVLLTHPLVLPGHLRTLVVVTGVLLQEPVVVRLEDEEGGRDVEHDLPGHECLPCEADDALV